MKEDNKQFKTIDLFKLIAALFVVLIHVNETHEYIPDMLVFSLSQFAVPFFFVVSGYFFHRRMSRSENPHGFLREYVKKQLKLYALWQIVILYPNIRSYMRLYKGRSVFYIFLVILRRILLCGGSVFWYILVLAESAIVIYLIWTNKRSKWLLYLAVCVGLILGFIYDNRTTVALFSRAPFTYVNRAFYLVFSWSNNFIMKGIPFMGIGCLISEGSPKLLTGKKTGRIALIFFFLATGINFFLFHIGKAVYFMFFVQAVSFFMISIAWETGFSAKVSLYFREISSSIYFVHTFAIYYVINVFFGLYWNMVLRYCTAVLISCIVYLIVRCIIKRFNSSLLRLMFNIHSVPAPGRG